MYTTLTHELYRRQLLECLYTDLAIRVKIARVVRTTESITNSLSGLSTLAAMTWAAEPRSTNVWVMVGHETQSQAHVKHEKLITLGSSRSTQLLGDGRRLENYSIHMQPHETTCPFTSVTLADARAVTFQGASAQQHLSQVRCCYVAWLRISTRFSPSAFTVQ